MHTYIKWIAPALLVAVAGVADAAVTAGNVKAVNADEQTFVLTDTKGKDWTLSFGKDMLINRDGKEGQAGLKVGDTVHVCYEKGVVANTAHYVLVQSGDNKEAELSGGAVKSFDAATKKLTWTDETERDWTFSIADASIRRNRADATSADIKIGDKVMVMTRGKGDAAKATMVILNPK